MGLGRGFDPIFLHGSLDPLSYALNVGHHYHSSCHFIFTAVWLAFSCIFLLCELLFHLLDGPVGVLAGFQCLLDMGFLLEFILLCGYNFIFPA